MPKDKTKKYVSLNNLRSKQSVNDIWPISVILQKKILSKSFTKATTQKLVPGPFLLAKNQAQHPLENQIFEASYSQ